MEQNFPVPIPNIPEPDPKYHFSINPDSSSSLLLSHSAASHPPVIHSNFTQSSFKIKFFIHLDVRYRILGLLRLVVRVFNYEYDVMINYKILPIRDAACFDLNCLS
ncbi:hypothetical protein ACS0TY_002066 [Phlomoides rotata]